VTPADVQRIARSYLIDAHRVAGHLQAHHGDDLAEELSEQTICRDAPADCMLRKKGVHIGVVGCFDRSHEKA